MHGGLIGVSHILAFPSPGMFGSHPVIPSKYARNYADQVHAGTRRCLGPAVGTPSVTAGEVE